MTLGNWLIKVFLATIDKKPISYILLHRVTTFFFWEQQSKPKFLHIKICLFCANFSIYLTQNNDNKKLYRTIYEKNSYSFIYSYKTLSVRNICLIWRTDSEQFNFFFIKSFQPKQGNKDTNSFLGNMRK